MSSDIAATAPPLMKRCGLGRAADAVAFVKKAQAGVDHVLRDEVRRLRHGEIVLRIARLRTAEGADLARAPRLRGEPLAHVVAVAQFAPLQRRDSRGKRPRSRACRDSSRAR